MSNCHSAPYYTGRPPRQFHTAVPDIGRAVRMCGKRYNGRPERNMRIGWANQNMLKYTEGMNRAERREWLAAMRQSNRDGYGNKREVK